MSDLEKSGLLRYDPVKANNCEVLDERGYETPDPRKIELVVDQAPPSLHQQIMDVLRSERRREILFNTDNELETWEEANDFDFPDDAPLSGFEVSIDQELNGATFEDETPIPPQGPPPPPTEKEVGAPSPAPVSPPETE